MANIDQVQVGVGNVGCARPNGQTAPYLPPADLVYTKGDKGDPGDIGPVGPTGQNGPQPQTFYFATPSLAWAITHNLGRYPAGLTKIDTAGELIHGSTMYPDLDHVVIYFSAPVSGTATLF